MEPRNSRLFILPIIGGIVIILIALSVIITGIVLLLDDEESCKGRTWCPKKTYITLIGAGAITIILSSILFGWAAKMRYGPGAWPPLVNTRKWGPDGPRRHLTYYEVAQQDTRF